MDFAVRKTFKSYGGSYKAARIFFAFARPTVPSVTRRISVPSALPESVSTAEMQTLRQAILGAASSGMSADDAMAFLKHMGVNYKNGGK